MTDPADNSNKTHAPAVDYNDGQWHIWRGGGRPIDQRSKVDLTYADGSGFKGAVAGNFRWDQPLMFRVTSPYVEPAKPREWWIVGGCEAWDNESDAMNSLKAMRHHDIVHVREVTE